MPLSPQARSLRGRIAKSVQLGDETAAVEARRAFRFVNAEDYIRRVVDGAPPLTDEQRRRLADILAPIEQGAA
jgi:hypothetical protein